MIRRLVWLLPFLILLSVGCQREVPPDSPETVISLLKNLVHSPDVGVRRTSAMALGKIGHPLVTSPLLEGLQDPDARVREYSAWGLGELGEQVSDRAGGPLVKLLQDPSDAVKQAAALALGEIGVEKNNGALVAQLIDLLHTGEVRERRAVVHAFRNLEIQSALPVLIGSLGDQDSLVRQGALSAIGELADVTTLSSFRRSLRQDADQGVRGEAAYRLGKLGDGQEASLLQSRAKEDSSAFVREWAVWALSMVTPQGDSD